MILLIKAAIMGIIEGITEFLPISSTGHMIITEQFIKMSANAHFVAAFEVVIQLGAILAVVWLFWNTLWPFSGTTEARKDKWNLWFKVVAAVIPATVIGLKYHDAIEAKLFNPTVVSFALIFWGIVIILLEVYKQRKNSVVATGSGVSQPQTIDSIAKINYPRALMIGFFQCLAMVPGTSRSAATIIGGELVGLSRPMAAEFSFFLAIPTMMGASLLTLKKQGIHFIKIEWYAIAVGFVVSFIVAMAVIKLFMNYIRNHDFKAFGYYRIILGITILLLMHYQILK